MIIFFIVTFLCSYLNKTTIIILGLLFALAAYYLRRNYTHWKRNGFPYDTKSTIPLGCLGSVVRCEKSMGMAIYDVYLRSKERFLGVYLLFRPGIVIRDAELARRVLAQDFSSFHDRGVYVDEKNDPMSASLFALRGQSWRSMRVKLSPCFTSGKLKGMFSTSENVGNKMVKHIESLLPSMESKEIDVKEVLTTYAIDIIGSTIFGLDINSYENPENKFRQLVTTARRNTRIGAIFGIMIFLVPNIAKFLFRLGFKNKFALDMRDIIKDTIEYREKHNIVRKDMLQLMMQLRNTGNIAEDDNNWNIQVTNDGQLKGISLELITAQAFIFYIAGQETTASTAAFTIFELAQYPELLKRAVNEVDEVLRQHNGQISYESLQKMEFLELCIQETIRKYPGLPILNRECTQDYKIPDTNLIIKKGTPVLIPLFGIHRDPENFPNPENYDPERFLETSRNYNPTAYMPFGEGPRICIAQRMGRMNSKLALVKVLQNFEVHLMEKREIEIDNNSIAIIPKGGVKVRLSRRTL